MKLSKLAFVGSASILLLAGGSFSSFAQEFDAELTTQDRENFAQALNESLDFGVVKDGQEASDDRQTIPGSTPLGQFVPFFGAEIEKVSIIENGSKVEKFWQALTPEQWKKALQDQFTQTLVYDAKSSGSLTALPGSVTLGKGSFKLFYHNFRYKNYPCSVNNPNAGSLLVGVGIRIDIDAKFKSGSFSFGLGQLALSASRKKISGSVEGNIVGLANSNTLSQVVGAAAGDLTYESLVEAGKAHAVANQAVENMVALTNPRIFGYRDLTEPGACLASLQADIAQ